MKLLQLLILNVLLCGSTITWSSDSLLFLQPSEPATPVQQPTSSTNSLMFLQPTTSPTSPAATSIQSNSLLLLQPTNNTPVTHATTASSLPLLLAQPTTPTVFAGDLIFTNSLYMIQSQTMALGDTLQSFFEWYANPPNPSETTTNQLLFLTPPPLTTGSSSTTVTAPSFFGGLSFDLIDTGTFVQIQNLLHGPSGSGSYTDLLSQLWSLYAQEYQSLQVQGATAQAQNVAQQPFMQSSAVVGVATQLTGQLLGFIKARVGTFSTTTFAGKGAQFFLITELPVLDTICQQIQKQFQTHLVGKSQDGYPNLTAFVSGDLLTTYTSTFTSLNSCYQQQKTTLLASFVINLLQSLSSCYTPALAQNQVIVNAMGEPFLSADLITTFSCLDTFCNVALSGLQTVDQTAAFGTYANPQQAVQAITAMLGSLYQYAALIGQNNLTQLGKSAEAITYQSQLQIGQGSSPSALFVQTVQKVVAQTNGYYQKAGQAFSASDPVLATAYANASAYLQQGLTSWKNAEKLMQTYAYGDAANAYQKAAVLFKNAGNVALASMLSRKADVATLSYYQMLVLSYAQYYQGSIATCINQMSTFPNSSVSAQDAAAWHTGYPDGFVQLFYYDPGTQAPATPPVFQGMAWLAGQAAASFAALLNAYQSDTSASAGAIKQNLTSGLLILEQLTQAAQGLFYNDALAKTRSIKEEITTLAPQQMAANANLGSSTAKGVVEGCLQHIKVYEQFKKMDSLLAASSAVLTSSTQSNPWAFVPFAGIFSGLPIAGFADFSLVAQIYWMILNIDPSIALVSSYTSYTQEVVSAALILGTYAGALSSDPTLQTALGPTYTKQLQKKVTDIAQVTYGAQQQTGLQLLTAQGAKILSEAKTALDYESALACFMAAGLLGDEGAQQQYVSALNTFATWYIKKSGLPFADLYAAVTYYRLYLAQVKGWKSVLQIEPLVLGSQSLQKFSQNLEIFLGSMLTRGTSQALANLETLQTLSDEMEFMLIRQEREQQLLGLSGKPLFASISTLQSASLVAHQVPPDFVQKQQPVITYSSPLYSKVTIPSFVDPTYNLAQVYYEQGKELFAQFKQSFASADYNVSLQGTYALLEKALEQSANLFTRSGHPDLVQQVQQLVTETVAYSYFSSVIPLQSTLDLIQKTFAQNPTFSQTFFTKQTSVLAPSKPVVIQGGSLLLPVTQPTSPIFTSSQLFSLQGGQASQLVQQAPPPAPTTVSLLPDEQPAYLCRYYEQDLTLLANQEAQLAPAKAAAQALVKSAMGKSLGGQQGPTYGALLKTATSLLGTSSTRSTTPTDTIIVSSIVVPLYQQSLMDGAYSSAFNTLQQEVDRYSKQVMGLVTGGVTTASSTLFASYTLEKRLVSGEEHIILTESNSPLPAVPALHDQLKTALFYYTLYTQFFSANPQAVQIAGQIYYQIEDFDGSKAAQAFKGVLGTYLVQQQHYNNIVNRCMQSAPPVASLEQLASYVFAPYQPWYQLVNSGYSWVLASLNNVQQVQENVGIYWISSSTMNSMLFAAYQQYMQDSARFLIGNPMSSSYKNLLAQIAGLSTVALTYAQSFSDQQQVYQALGGCYESAGDIVATYAQSFPSYQGYPTGVSTSLPNISSLDLTVSYSVAQCPFPSECAIPQLPSSFTLSWQQYINAASYYLQAYKQYQKGYLANPSGGITDFQVLQNDTNTRRAWGNYIWVTMQGIAQRISLFGRNAMQATVTPNADGTQQIAIDFSQTFSTIVMQGQTNGGQSAAQDFSALQGGGIASTTSVAVQAQYSIMKNLLLDSLIYCSGLQKLTGSLTVAQATGSQKTVANDPVAGRALQCGLAYFVPGVQMLVGQQQTIGAAYQAGTVGQNKTEDVSTETPVQLIAPQYVTLQALGNPVLKELLYVSTLPLFVQYCMGTLMGTSQGITDTNPYPLLTKQANINALNDFISQMYSFVQTAFMWSFLPPSVADDPQQLSNDVTSAMQAEEQNMIINPEAYVG